MRVRIAGRLNAFGENSEAVRTLVGIFPNHEKNGPDGMSFRGSTLWVHHLTTILSSPMKRLKHFLKSKRDKSPKPTSPANTTDVASQLSGFRAEWTPAPKVQSLSGPLLDCLDLTATLDGRGDIRPRIAFQVGKDEDQEPPASEASTSRVAIDVVGYRDDPMGECYRSLQLWPMFM